MKKKAKISKMDRSEYAIDHAIAEGMETLMADVIRKYPIIYDKSCKPKNGATFQENCDSAWNKISDELNLELDSCKSLWCGMKQKFIKHRKRLDNGEPVSAWPTYHKLYKWLDKHVKKRKSRQDYIKQMKLNPKPTTAKTDVVSNAEDDEDIDHDENTNDVDSEEWTELMEDKNTMVQVKLKRKPDTPLTCEKVVTHVSKSLGPSVGKTFEPKKKKFNIEVVTDNGTTTVYEDADLFNDASEQKTIIKDAEIVVLEESHHRAKQSTPQIEIIDVKETMLKTSSTSGSSDTDESILKIERILTRFTQSLERLSAANAVPSDSNDAFGRYIASMVRELPAHKRMKMRLSILQYATELIASETNPIE